MKIAQTIYFALVLICSLPFEASAQQAVIETTFFSVPTPKGYSVDWDRRSQILFAPEVQDPSSRIIFVFYCSAMLNATAPEACTNSEQEWIAWWEAGGNTRQPFPSKFQKRVGPEDGPTEYLMDGIGEARDGGPTPYFSIRVETRSSGRVMVYAVSQVSAADASRLANSILGSVQWRP